MNRPSRWQGVPDAIHTPPGLLLWPVVLLRAGLFAALTLLLLPVFLVVRLVDYQWPGRYRAHHVVSFWSALLLVLFGLRVRLHGQRFSGPGAIVANHSSWLDILTLHQVAPIRFVAKAEVRKWFLIGFLARISGTLFIERKRSHSKEHQTLVRRRLMGGQILCLFPEGTSSDGLRVLPFKSTLFGALHEFGFDGEFMIQPVSVVYRPATGLRPDFYGWWGTMGFETHIASVLSRSWTGVIDIVLHDPIRVGDVPDRKALARLCEDRVREGHARMLGISLSEQPEKP
jgi:lyso-ornithine lipid O-acyltransferase